MPRLGILRRCGMADWPTIHGQCTEFLRFLETRSTLFVNPLALTLVTAMVSAALATPVVVSWMWRWKILDAPDGVRKLHGRTVPLAGGVAVLVACCVATLLTLLAFPQAHLRHHGDLLFTIGLGCACVWICVLGIVDDQGKLRGRQKFVGQVIGAAMLTSSGCVIARLEFMDVHLELGLLSVPFTIFWLVGAINAVNLIDGIDGLATSIGAILSGTFALMAVITGHHLEAVLGVALCGALLGFLPYNFPRARIFLGDTGSMLIGLLLGTLALRSSVKSQATLTLAAPLAVLSILIFDVGMAILRRKLTGRSLYATDRGHLHHRLTQLGFQPLGVVLFVSLACALCSAGALASLVYRNEWIAIIVAGTVIFGCVLAKVFGYSEFHLLGDRTLGFLRTLFRLSPPGGSKGVMSAMQIQGRLNWTPIWNELREFAQGMDLVRVEFYLSAPRLHENYHAEWSRRIVDIDRQWRMTIPLVHQGSIVGRVMVNGELSQLSTECSVEQIADIVLGLKPVEIQIEDLLTHATVQELQAHAITAA